MTDPLFVRIPDNNLQMEIAGNAGNLNNMLEVLLRATRHGQGAQAYKILSDLASQQPKNTCVLQGLYFLETIASGNYWLNPGIRITGLSIPENNEQKNYSQLLSRSIQSRG